METKARRRRAGSGAEAPPAGEVQRLEEEETRREDRERKERRGEVVREGWPDRRVKAYAEEKIGKK